MDGRIGKDAKGKALVAAALEGRLTDGQAEQLVALDPALQKLAWRREKPAGLAWGLPGRAGNRGYRERGSKYRFCCCGLEGPVWSFLGKQ